MVLTAFSLERSFGHRITKADLMSEFLSNLQVAANKARKDSAAPDFESRSCSWKLRT